MNIRFKTNLSDNRIKYFIFTTSVYTSVDLSIVYETETVQNIEADNMNVRRNNYVL